MPSTDNRIFSQIRLKRLCAFIIDICAIGLLAYAAYAYFKFPDFFLVKRLMDEINQAGAGATQAMVNQALALFNTAYFQSLLIWLGYEIVCQFILRGATLGKLAMRIKVIPVNPARGILLHYLLMTVRSVLKVLLAYIFQGIPLLLAALAIFVNKDSQSGYDFAVRSKVAAIEPVDRREVKGFPIQKSDSAVKTGI
jgi:hypothetical protein